VSLLSFRGDGPCDCDLSGAAKQEMKKKRKKEGERAGFVFRLVFESPRASSGEGGEMEKLFYLNIFFYFSYRTELPGRGNGF